jgi:hypothetical protein
VAAFSRGSRQRRVSIAYVYLACLLILSLLRVVISKVVDFVGWSNLFGLRNAIARERGIAAYRAWVPFERIRPAGFPRKDGKRDLLGPLITNRHTLRSRNGFCAGSVTTEEMQKLLLGYNVDRGADNVRAASIVPSNSDRYALRRSHKQAPSAVVWH